MFKSRLISILTIISIAVGGLFATSAPASAASTDATLSGLTVTTGQNSRDAGLRPAFDAAQTWYQFVTVVDDVNFTATANDGGATIRYKWGTHNDVIASGSTETITFTTALTVVTVEVTAADGTTKKSYTVNVGDRVLPQPKVVSVTPSTVSTLGGSHVVVTIKDAIPEGNYNGVYCRTEVNSYVPGTNDNSGSWMIAEGTPDNNGNSVYNVEIYNLWDYANDVSYKGKADIGVRNYCNPYDDSVGWWRDIYSTSRLKDGLTFADPVASSISITGGVATPTGQFVVHGTNINSSADIEGYLFDPAHPGEFLGIGTWSWKDNNSAAMYFETRAYDANWEYTYDNWNKPSKKTLVLLDCERYTCYDNNDFYDSIDVARAKGELLYTTTVDYAPDLPSNVTVSPTKGSVNGGTTIKITGHHLGDPWNNYLPVKIGGIDATNVTQLRSDDWWSLDGTETYSAVVPAAPAAGAASITISNRWGDTTLSSKFNYGAKPEITSVAPATVSNSGGSLITLTGKNFGTLGTPSVTIDGIKSPCVTRVSDTKVVAMVPADAATGSVDVNLIAGTGGGSPDLPAQISLAASSANPTVKTVTPNKIAIGGGDEIVITGTNFGAAGTVGVTIGGNCATVSASSATSITVQTPSGDASGAADIVVGSTTGTLTKVGGVTYVATPGITSVAPSTIASSATGSDAKVTITGVGLGASGTIKVGAGKAVAYTSTNSGTTIANVAIPTSTVGSVLVSITPKGAKTAFTTSVRVKAPVVTYVGPNPHDNRYDFLTGFENDEGASYRNGFTAYGPAAGGSQLRIEGSGFGVAGTVKFGTVSVTPTTWTDELIVLSTPALATGSYDVKVVPAAGSGTATVTLGYNADVQPATPTFDSVVAVVDNGRENQPFTFDPAADASDVYQINGTGYLGTDSGAATRLLIADYNGNNGVTVVPYAITSSSLKFHAPRSFAPVQWVNMTITTNVSSVFQTSAMRYVGNAPQPTVFSPGAGLCTKDAIGTYNPGSFSLTGPSLFGASGTVTLDGVALPAGAVSWSDSSISVNLGAQTADLANPWGNKTVVFTPSDSSKLPLTYNFFCGVATNITTKLNGSTNALTLNAGTAYTASAEMVNPLPGTTFVEPADGYQWVTAADHSANGWNRGVNNGLPVAAGDYYVRARIGVATYDTTKYFQLTSANDVHLVLSGTAITFTPKLTSGSAVEVTYSGPLGDGKNGSTNDITYTTSITPADAITAITYEFRNHDCTNNGWSSGLPTGVALNSCTGDGSVVSSWDIRVRSFDMVSGSVNKNIYYLPTYNVFNLKINKKSLTISAVSASKVYDGTTNINLGAISVTGAVNDETPTLNTQASGAQFADANAGTGKAITLASPLVLAGAFNRNYALTNPDIVFTGTIKKSDASLRLTSSVPSVIMSNVVPVEITATVKDTNSHQTPDPASGISDVVLVSASTGVCTISGTTVTVLKAGDCVIKGTQAASTNYNATKAYSDDSLTTETITIKVFASPKSVQVVADDLSIAVGSSIDPTASATGLIDGDALGNVSFDVYQGATLLNAMPTTPGTYKIVPKDASLQAADMSAYTNTIKYVAGKLIITQLPPVITTVAPSHGPEAGGTVVTITGTKLDTVTSITFGSKTLRKPTFTVNGDGTQITFKTAAGKGQVDLILHAGNATADSTYTYDAPPVVAVTEPLSLSLELKLVVGAKFEGQDVTIQGGGLKPNSDYTLVLHSTAVVVYKGIADADGNFLQIVKMPAKACVEAGTHTLTLTGIKPNGKATSAVASFSLAANCVVGTGAAVKNIKKGKVTWTLSGFLFKYRDANLTPAGLKSLDQLIKNIKGAKVVSIFGYTETDTTSAVIKKANLFLAKARTESVKAYLKSKGINAVFHLFGKGGVNPVSLTDQSKNRRVVIDATF